MIVLGVCGFARVFFALCALAAIRNCNFVFENISTTAHNLPDLSSSIEMRKIKKMINGMAVGGGETVATLDGPAYDALKEWAARTFASSGTLPIPSKVRTSKGCSPPESSYEHVDEDGFKEA